MTSKRRERTRPRAFFWGYDLEEPSFRHRMIPLYEELERRGWTCRVDAIEKGRYLRRLVRRRREIRGTDVLLLHRIKMTPLELTPLRRWPGRIVFDVDDAIYFRRPRRLGLEPDRSWFRRFKFDRTCSASDLTMVCNRTLASVAARSARRVEIVPTAVELTEFERHRAVRTKRHTVTWIGLPENLPYLEIIRPVLGRLRHRFPELRLRVVSSHTPLWSELPIEAVPWSQGGEAASLATAGVGVMPLADDDWTRGKCAFKLLQYMAAALPCVGSPVGANVDVIDDGVTGFLAATEDDWERSLGALLEDPERAERMGRQGRERVRTLYDRPVVITRAADLIEELLTR